MLITLLISKSRHTLIIFKNAISRRKNKFESVSPLIKTKHISPYSVSLFLKVLYICLKKCLYYFVIIYGPQ